MFSHTTGFDPHAPTAADAVRQRAGCVATTRIAASDDTVKEKTRRAFVVIRPPPPPPRRPRPGIPIVGSSVLFLRPRDGGVQPSIDGPFCTNRTSGLSGLPVRY